MRLQILQLSMLSALEVPVCFWALSYVSSTRLFWFVFFQVVEHASVCLTRIAEASATSSEKLDMLCSYGLIPQATRLISGSNVPGSLVPQTTLSSSTYTVWRSHDVPQRKQLVYCRYIVNALTFVILEWTFSICLCRFWFAYFQSVLVVHQLQQRVCYSSK